MTVTEAAVPFQVVPDLTTLVTVKVTDVAEPFSVTATLQVPALPVVHVFVPVAPPDSRTVTVAPETAAAVGDGADLGVPVAVQLRFPTVFEPVIVACVAVAGGGGGGATSRVWSSRLGEPVPGLVTTLGVLLSTSHWPTCAVVASGAPCR